MFKSLSVLIVAGVVLTSCGSVRESRLNPFNWFGGSESVAVDPAATGANNPLIPKRRASVFRAKEAGYAGHPVETVSELLIERRPGGAIIRVTGVADRAGPFEVRLIKDEDVSDDNTLAYTLKALQSAGPRNTGERARMVTAALWLTEQELAGIREIRVAGRTNARASRR
ncbi:hypothetical protein M4578_17600 [Salipiger sp. P9]|uniref:hypothetical protein n=1 Tax=Salipiger pentaromativorans TaxID=2943193 RepID=UPI0021584043|nr:hypothetical protein [Salipiger pentaromativorans]MCR8549649.1 hypothetical protein [Salipiger pentaromativorans]